MPDPLDECPGCLNCDNCDTWDGKHLWIDYFKNPDATEPYSMCDFCYETRDSE